MKHIFTRFLLIFAVIFSLIFTACDPAKAKRTVRDLRVKSAELSTYGLKLTTAFGDAFKAGELTQEQLATLNKGTGAFTAALGIYRQAIMEAERLVASGQPLPVGTIDRLNTILDSQVIAAFFDILVKVGALPLAQSAAIQTAISAIRLTLLALKGAFSDARHMLNEQEARSWT